jgi:hypothetical protein
MPETRIEGGIQCGGVGLCGSEAAGLHARLDQFLVPDAMKVGSIVVRIVIGVRIWSGLGFEVGQGHAVSAPISVCCAVQRLVDVAHENE